jgi:hypothetical protein
VLTFAQFVLQTDRGGHFKFLAAQKTDLTSTSRSAIRYRSHHPIRMAGWSEP